ncbi:F-box/kelch-repeat protein At3g06240-like [Lotus japonicus]|uniref:F-box/kelch-repeat protein At3g06240-like n=1 Tax=Lotus japonicus TaxID=34305 RepID=UPI00258BC1C5|nr:F-box/kelch-repeat protein At3g06240-like [Lotus japonicus]
MKRMKNFSLPVDMMVEILLRLPIKSLLRFKCVCKSWLSLISDPQFAKSHFDLAAAPTDRLIITFRGCMEFEAASPDDHDRDLVHLNYPCPPPPPRTRPRYILQVPVRSHSSRHLQAIGYCRGIMLLGNMSGDAVVWNPSTGTHRQIPVSYDKIDPSLPNKGYRYRKKENIARKFSDTDKNSHPRIQVFSLKTNVPSFIYGVDFEYDQYQDPYDRAGVFFNQSLHWMVKSKATGLVLVFAFDLIDRSLSEIHLSDDCMKLYRDDEHHCYLNVLGGCLGLHFFEGDDDDEIWVMKEYKVSSSWTRCFLIPNKDVNGPICLTKDGALLVDGYNKIMELNEDGGVLKHHLNELLDIHVSEYRYPYRESLLPLP